MTTEKSFKLCSECFEESAKGATLTFGDGVRKWVCKPCAMMFLTQSAQAKQEIFLMRQRGARTASPPLPNTAKDSNERCDAGDSSDRKETEDAADAGREIAPRRPRGVANSQWYDEVFGAYEIPVAPLRASDACRFVHDRGFAVELLSNGVLSPLFRRRVWLACARSGGMVRAVGDPFDEFQRFLDCPVAEEDDVQIEKDLGRTNCKDEAEMLALRRVLRAYSVRNREVGYAQSLNFVGQRLLELCVGCEHEAFWMLAFCVEHIAVDYYVRDMQGVRVDLTVLSDLLRLRDRELWRHFRLLELSMSMLASKWLLCLGIDVIADRDIPRLWDHMFCTEGMGVLMDILVERLVANRETLLEATDPVDCVMFMGSPDVKSVPILPATTTASKLQALREKATAKDQRVSRALGGQRLEPLGADMLKRGDKGLVKLWRKRRFEYNPFIDATKIDYFDVDEWCGAIILRRDSTVVSMEDGRWSVSVGTRLFQLDTENERVKEQWCRVIAAAIDLVDEDDDDEEEILSPQTAPQ